MFTMLGKPTSAARANDNTVRAVNEAHRRIEENRVRHIESLEAAETRILEVRSDVATLIESTKQAFADVDQNSMSTTAQIVDMLQRVDHMRHWTHEALDGLERQLENDRQLARQREMSINERHSALATRFTELDGYVGRIPPPKSHSHIWLAFTALVVLTLALRLI
jgi:chromosome segregation ATPase